MHVRTVKTTLYSFGELSPDAQQRAVENRCRIVSKAWDADDTEFVFEDAAHAAALLGWDIRQTRKTLCDGSHRYDPTIYYSGFWSQGDGACCEGEWRARNFNGADLKAEYPQDAGLHRIADEFAAVVAKYPDAAFTVKHRGHYSHSSCTEFTFDSGCDASTTEGEELENLFYARSGPADDLKQAARNFMDWIYRRLEAEYNYQTGEEAAREYLTDCEGEVFDIDGNIV